MKRSLFAFFVFLASYPFASVAAQGPARVIRTASTTDAIVGKPFTVQVLIEVNEGTTQQPGIAVAFPTLTELGSRGAEYSSSQALVRMTSLSTGAWAYCRDGVGGPNLFRSRNGASGALAHLWVQAGWLSPGLEKMLSLQLTITPHLAGRLKVRIGVLMADPTVWLYRGGTSSGPGWDTQDIDVSVDEALSPCVRPDEGSNCEVSRAGKSYTHVAYLQPVDGFTDARQPGQPTPSSSVQPMANNRANVLAEGPDVGTGWGVLNNYQGYIDDYRYVGLGLLGYYNYWWLQDYYRNIETASHGLIWDSVMEDDDNYWNSSSEAPGVDAHVYTAGANDYLYYELGQNGYDGYGSIMRTVVDYYSWLFWGEDITDNAEWNPAAGEVRIGQGSSYLSLAGARDVVAHEWGHAITGAYSGPGSSGATADFSGEPGALSEAFSDWFGIVVKQYYGSSSWVIGSPIHNLRDLSSPHSYVQPEYYLEPGYWVSTTQTCSSSNDWCGRHTNDGVPNKMFYLLAHGGTFRGVSVTGIGNWEAMTVAHKANTLLWPSNSTFSYARACMIAEARSIFGAAAAEANQVRNAWAAVGVGAPADNQGPSVTITSPASGATVNSATITVSGTASDSGRGNNGISSVTVNGTSASGGSASGSNTANWSAQISLTAGQNTITVVAKDNCLAADDACSSQNSTTVPITVYYVACAYSLSSNSGSVPSNGGTGSFSVTTSSGCSWTASSSNTSWLTVTSGSSGSGTGTVSYSATANGSTSQRTATITVTASGYSGTYTVTQAGISCSYSLSSNSGSLPSNGGTGSFTVTAASGCGWTASSSDTSWLTVTSGGSGSGNGTVSYSATANSSTSQRTATITVTASGYSGTYTVTQAGIGCSYSLSSNGGSVPSNGGTGNFTATATSGCSWTASSSDTSWLTVTSGSSGSGTGTVSYSATANGSSSQRTATITVTGSGYSGTYTLTQAGTSSGGWGGMQSITPFSAVTGAAAQVHSTAVDSNGNIYLLIPYSGGLAVMKSTDGGSSFRTPVQVPNSAYANFAYQMAIDPGNTIHVAWWDSDTRGSETYYSRSTDGAGTFSAPIRVRTGNSYNGYSTDNAAYPVVAADGAGNVYVAYGAYTKNSVGTFVGYNIWVSKSTSGGASFQPEFYISGPDANQKFPRQIYATASGFYILFMDETNYDLYVHRGSASSVVQNATRINPNPGKALWGGDVALGPNGTTLYAALSDTSNDYEGDIRFCKSTDSGATWGSCLWVNDNTSRNQDQPAIIRDSHGTLHAIWSDHRVSSGRYQLYYAYSVNDGASFSTPNVNLSNDAPNDYTHGHLVEDPPRSLIYISGSENYSQLVLAHGSVAPGTAVTLTVASSNPSSGVSITVSPVDNSGNGNGTTQFTRAYNQNTAVMLTAPATAAGNSFQRWQKDGADAGASATVTVTMDTAHTMTAVYAAPVTLTVASSPTGVLVTVTPNDNNGNGNGTTQFTRTYGQNTAVALTAPATAGGCTFSKWQKDSADAGTTVSITVTMDANHTMTAVYGGCGGDGTLAAEATSGAPSAQARIPIKLTLRSGVSVDTLLFAVQISANGAAPALTGALDFEKAGSLPDPVKDTNQLSNYLSAAWLSPLSPAMTGTSPITVGYVLVNIPASAKDGDSYNVQVTSVQGALGTNMAALVAGADATLTVRARPYFVGDLFPMPSTGATGGDHNNDGDYLDAGEFGDGNLNILDLIYALRMVTGVMPVPKTKDAFDAADSYPRDTDTTRGGDCNLNIVDLIITLRRVTGIDTTRPQRYPRAQPCPSGAQGQFELMSARTVAARRAADEAAPVILELGTVQGAEAGAQVVPVYLRGRQDVNLAGLAFAVGLEGEGRVRLRFVPNDAFQAPSLVDDGLPGVLALAWLEGLRIAAGQQLLLGWIETAAGHPLLRIYGFDAQADGTNPARGEAK
jgi:hypothetical protein